MFHKKAKTTKKVVLRLECTQCKTKAQLALKRCKHFELGYVGCFERCIDLGLTVVAVVTRRPRALRSCFRHVLLSCGVRDGQEGSRYDRRGNSIAIQSASRTFTSFARSVHYSGCLQLPSAPSVKIWVASLKLALTTKAGGAVPLGVRATCAINPMGSQMMRKQVLVSECLELTIREMLYSRALLPLAGSNQSRQHSHGPSPALS